MTFPGRDGVDKQPPPEGPRLVLRERHGHDLEHIPLLKCSVDLRPDSQDLR